MQRKLVLLGQVCELPVLLAGLVEHPVVVLRGVELIRQLLDGAVAHLDLCLQLLLELGRVRQPPFLFVLCAPCVSFLELLLHPRHLQVFFRRQQ